MRDVKIVAVCDSRPGQLAAKSIKINVALERRHFDIKSCRTYTDIDAMLGAEKLDFMVTALPTDLHAKLAIKALKAGCHVFGEKPMALTSQACDAIIAAARLSKRQFMTGQCLRFWPEYEFLRAAVESRRYGKLTSLYMERISAMPRWSADNWMMDHQRSGGGILDLHLHDADWAIHALGRPRRLMAAGTRGPSGGFDDVSAIWDYGSFNVTIRCSWIARGFTSGFRAIFERAVVENGVSEKPGLHVTQDDKSKPVKVTGPNGYINEMRYFIDCITGKKKNTHCTPASTRESVRMIEFERESIRRNRWITTR
jgi:predicted dehydrogenase